MNTLIILFFLKSLFGNISEYEIPAEGLSRISWVDIVEINNKMYYYDRMLSQDCSIALVNIEDSTDIINLIIEVDWLYTNNCEKYLMTNICSDADTLIFCVAKKVIKYVYDGSTELKLDKIYDLDEIFKQDRLYYANRIILDKGILVGLSDTYRPKSSNKDDLFSWQLSLSDTNHRFINIEYTKGFYWTLFQPRNVIDYFQGSYAVTDITNYSIYIKDKNFQTLDTLTRKFDNWKANTYELEKFDGKHPMAVISFLQSDTITRNLIHRVNFLDANHLLVCYSDNDDLFLDSSHSLYNFKYDIWAKKDNHWFLESSDISLSEDKMHNSYILQHKNQSNMLYHFGNGSDGFYKVVLRKSN
ncbi:MAG: hypothetical protein CVV22_09260 [Ignavibacteriae bacterium HGW-Ignavibacteriae-1]|jgi:hypothetical protein|nr:MAG: hypothetical protein CVV22_09260 [Ignavibacteriae bacterium HGW-Ignavibacteriae-1]